MILIVFLLIRSCSSAPHSQHLRSEPRVLKQVSEVEGLEFADDKSVEPPFKGTAEFKVFEIDDDDLVLTKHTATAPTHNEENTNLQRENLREEHLESLLW